MKKVILDTSFILSAVRNKIDFFEEIKLRGIEIVIPKQAIAELIAIAGSKKKLRFREDAGLALKLLEKNNFQEIDIGKGHVDKKIINYSKENPEIAVATLDSELKNKLTNPKIVIREKKRLEVV